MGQPGSSFPRRYVETECGCPPPPPLQRSVLCAVLTLAPLRVLQVSGMKIRFLTLIRELRKAGDEVLVVTPDRNPPATYHGAKVRMRPTEALNPTTLCGVTRLSILTT